MIEEGNAAIYLVGQGTYYRPRLIEVQFYQIIRYMQLLEREGQEQPWIKKTFVDLHPRCWRSDFPSPEDLPQLVSLCAAVKQGEYQTVFIDLVSDGGMKIVKHELTQAGARVINVCYDETVLQDAFARRFGVDFDPHSDTSDFITFFPNLAGEIGRMLTGQLEANDLPSLKKRIDILERERATAGHSYDRPLLPFWQEGELLDQRDRK